MKDCPKCAGKLIQGFMPDRTHGGTFLHRWHKGAPSFSLKSFWSEMRCNWSDSIPIAAFRCEACGFLELYADQSFDTTKQKTDSDGRRQNKAEQGGDGDAEEAV